MDKLTIRDVDITGKRVLVRVDFNVPLDEKTGKIIDDSRIRAALPTIKYLIDHRARVILCSHLGRPDGKVVESLRLAGVARRLSQILGKQVKTAGDCIGPEVEESVKSLKSGDILLLENLRFHPEEEAADPLFARELAKLADLYVNDAFGVSHRAHASVATITKYLPAVSGFLLEKEVDTLTSVVVNPAHPLGGLFGGAKVKDKVGVLENIMGKVDFLLIGGGMAATFLKAKSYDVGKSSIEADRLSTAQSLMETAAKKGVHVSLPVDVVVTGEKMVEGEVVSVEGIPADKKIVDIGPVSINNFSQELKKCKTIFWNGPMGIYEMPQFAKGTQALAQLLASLKATTIVGGGSTADVVIEMGLADKISFISTGGGASLEFLGGQKLPGVEVLLDKSALVEGKVKGLQPAK